MAFKVCLKVFSFKGVVWTKDSLVLGWSGQKTPWCQGWISTKESFGQITPATRSLLAKSPLKTLKAISQSARLHQGVIWPNHCRGPSNLSNAEIFPSQYSWMKFTWKIPVLFKIYETNIFAVTKHFTRIFFKIVWPLKSICAFSKRAFNGITRPLLKWILLQYFLIPFFTVVTVSLHTRRLLP